MNTFPKVKFKVMRGENGLFMKSALVPEIAKIRLDADQSTYDLLFEMTEEIVRYDTELQEKNPLFRKILSICEAAGSAELSGIHSDPLQVGLAVQQKPVDDAAKLVLSLMSMNNDAFYGPLINRKSFFKLHKSLFDHTDSSEVGRFRNANSWIERNETTDTSTLYLPPSAEMIEENLADLLKFMQRHDINPILLAAVAHAQFESIHPFAQGNDLIGRGLIQNIFHNLGLVRTSVLPVSLGLRQDQAGYFEALTQYRYGSLDPILAQIAHATKFAIRTSQNLIHRLEHIRFEWGRQIIARPSSKIWELCDLLLSDPVVSALYVSIKLQISDLGARKLIAAAQKANILRPINDAKRGVLYQAFEIIDSFTSLKI